MYRFQKRRVETKENYACYAMLFACRRFEKESELTSDQIREFARKRYVEPARARGERRIRVRAGDVHKELTLRNRVPAVCQALESKIFLQDNNLIIESKEGPPSGLSTSVVFTYRVADNFDASPNPGGLPAAENPSARFLGLLQLKGIGKEIFASLGGGESFIRSERKAFADAIEKQDRERGLL